MTIVHVLPDEGGSGNFMIENLYKVEFPNIHLPINFFVAAGSEQEAIDKFADNWKKYVVDNNSTTSILGHKGDIGLFSHFVELVAKRDFIVELRIEGK
jgi:hypothetical protein